MKINRIIPVVIILLLAYASSQADRVVTTRKHLNAKQAILETNNDDTAPVDTIINPTTQLSFSGYEKSLSSNHETIFITNHTDSTITQLIFTINYLDTSNRQIHSRHINTNQLRKNTLLPLPPHATQRIDLPSWDKQKSYYYINGKHPRSSATPYTITIHPDTLLYHP